MEVRKKVLLVDDDEDFVAIHKSVLERNGYDVLVAHNGQECFEKIRQEKADLIVLDMMMSTTTEGFNISRDLRNSEYTKNIPLLMVTAINTRSPFKFEPDPTWLPVDVLIEKPIQPERLLAEINRILKS